MLVQVTRPAKASVRVPDPLPEPLLSPGDPIANQNRTHAPLLEGGLTFEDTLVELVNQERWNNGQLPPLKRSSELDSASETHSVNQAVRNFFGHCDLDTGTWPDDRMQVAGYFPNGWGENIAAGYHSPSSVMDGWMGSSGHRANILSTTYREIGVGYNYDSFDSSTVRKDLNTDCQNDGSPGGPYFHYWTQNFGKRNGVYPVVINREEIKTTSRTVNIYLYGEGWAQEMRFCNGGRMWSEWEPFDPNTSWSLAGANGLKTVLAEIRNGSTVLRTSDTIWFEEALKNPAESGGNVLFLPIISKPLVAGEFCGFQ